MQKLYERLCFGSIHLCNRLVDEGVVLVFRSTTNRAPRFPRLQRGQLKITQFISEDCGSAHCVEEKYSNCVTRPGDGLAFLYLRDRLQGLIQMRSLSSLFCGIVMQVLHGFGAAYGKQYDISFAIEELSSWSKLRFRTFCSVKVHSRTCLAAHPLRRCPPCSRHR